RGPGAVGPSSAIGERARRRASAPRPRDKPRASRPSRGAAVAARRGCASRPESWKFAAAAIPTWPRLRKEARPPRHGGCEIRGGFSCPLPAAIFAAKDDALASDSAPAVGLGLLLKFPASRRRPNADSGG